MCHWITTASRVEKKNHLQKRSSRSLGMRTCLFFGILFVVFKIKKKRKERKNSSKWGLGWEKKIQTNVTTHSFWLCFSSAYRCGKVVTEPQRCPCVSLFKLNKKNGTNFFLVRRKSKFPFFSTDNAGLRRKTSKYNPENETENVMYTAWD